MMTIDYMLNIVTTCDTGEVYQMAMDQLETIIRRLRADPEGRKILKRIVADMVVGEEDQVTEGSVKTFTSRMDRE